MSAIWKSCPDLMERLGETQNHPAHVNQDIMTWAAMCDTREELEAHVIRNEESAANYVPLIRRGRGRKAA